MRLGFNFDKEPFEIAGDEFVSYYGKNFHKTNLQKDSKFVLSKIESKQISQSILSAAMQDFLSDWIIAHKLEKYFFKIVGIDNQYAKGKIEQGLKLINDLPYNSEDILMIGDTNHDSDVAEKMKINCILIDHGHVNRGRLKNWPYSIIKFEGCYSSYNVIYCPIRSAISKTSKTLIDPLPSISAARNSTG